MKAIKEYTELSPREMQDAANSLQAWWWIRRILILLFIIIAAGMAGCPAYNVYTQSMTGTAELERAKQNRQMVIEEAKALKESAQYKADAETIRATGINAANHTIAEGLGGPEGYLRYLYIDALTATNCQTIYIPTEAGLPILEARSK